MHDSTQCPICRRLPARGGVTDRQFDQFVDACQQELAIKQPKFMNMVSTATNWAYDLSGCSITFDDAVYQSIPIGSFSPKRNTWLWGWGNDRFPDSARKAAAAIQDLNKLTRFDVFISPGFPASDAEADDLVALAVHQLDAAGFFRVQSDESGSSLFLAVML